MSLVIGISGIICTGLAILTLSGKVAPWTGRFYSLLDPSYAKNNIPIIASVSEHQPTSWSSFYGVFAVYFAGVMVRLMLVLAPVMCILGGIAVSSSLSTYMKYLDTEKASSNGVANGKPAGSKGG